MFLLLPSLILVIYAITRGILLLRIAKWEKFLLSIIVIFCGLKYQIYGLGEGSLIQPSVSRSAQLVLETLYGSLIFFVGFLFLKDFYLLLQKSKKALNLSNTSKSTVSGKWIFSFAIISLMGGTFATYEAIKVPEVTSVQIRIPSLSSSWQGLRIVQLSDLHIGAIQKKEWLAKIVKKVNALNPDLVVITGDFVDGSVKKLYPELFPLKEINAPYGVYGIVGNHEYYSGYQDWVDALRTLNIKMLENQSVVLKRNDEPLVLGGTTDFGAYRFNMPNPDLKKTFQGTPVAPRILLTHQPKTTYRSTEPFDLQLSGHTHGAHLFFLYPLVGWFNDWLVSDHYKRGDRQIYVNRGTGLWNGFTQRLGVPSEITLITLH